MQGGAGGDADDGRHRLARGQEQAFIAAEPDLRVRAQEAADLPLRTEGKIPVSAGKAGGQRRGAVPLQIFADLVAIALDGARAGGVKEQRLAGALFAQPHELAFGLCAERRRQQEHGPAPGKVLSDILALEKKVGAFQPHAVEAEPPDNGARPRKFERPLGGAVEFFGYRIVRFLSFPAQVAQKFLSVHLHYTAPFSSSRMGFTLSAMRRAT